MTMQAIIEFCRPAFEAEDIEKLRGLQAYIDDAYVRRICTPDTLGRALLDAFPDGRLAETFGTRIIERRGGALRLKAEGISAANIAKLPDLLRRPQ
jgi:hypothetical protein